MVERGAVVSVDRSYHVRVSLIASSAGPDCSRVHIFIARAIQKREPAQAPATGDSRWDRTCGIKAGAAATAAALSALGQCWAPHGRACRGQQRREPAVRRHRFVVLKLLAELGMAMGSAEAGMYT